MALDESEVVRIVENIAEEICENEQYPEDEKLWLYEYEAYVLYHALAEYKKWAYIIDKVTEKYHANLKRDEIEAEIAAKEAELARLKGLLGD